MANNTNWRLSRYQPESFAGITQDMGIVVMFPEDQRIMGHTGDQGAGKTSSLECLKLLMGAEPIENAINKQDGTMAGELEILQDDKKYIARFNKSNFIVTLVQSDGTKSKIDSPKTFMKNLIGPQGLDPMEIKGKDGTAQISWLRKMFKLSEDEVKTETSIKESYERSYKERTATNKEVARLKIEVASDGYFEYDPENKTFVPTSKMADAKVKIASGAADAQAINSKFNAAQELKNEAIRAIALMDQIRDEASAVSSEVQRLKDQLQLKEALLNAKKERIAAGEEHNKKYLTVDKGLEDAQQAVMKLHENKSVETAIKSAENNYILLNEKIDDQVNVNAKIEETKTLIKKMVKAFTPEIEGLEVKVASVVDVEFESMAYRELNPGCTDRDAFMHVEKLKTDNKDGLFYQGKSVAEMSESELYSMCVKIWEFMGVRVVFIENITSLGSEAIDVINMFAEKGYVFYSEMDRKQKDLKIHFHNKIT